MAELNLSACPICQARDRLVRQTRTVRETSYVWYECQQCGSVLLQAGANTWTYQKIGRADMSYLLKRPLTMPELQAMAPSRPTPVPEPVPGMAPEPWHKAASGIVPAEKGSVIASARHDAETKQAPRQPDVSPTPTTTAKPAKRSPRVVVIAFAGLALCILISLAVLVGMTMLNRQKATPPSATDAPSDVAVAAASSLPATPTPTYSAVPTVTPWPTATPIPPTPTATPDPELLAVLDAIEGSVVKTRGLEEISPVHRVFTTQREMAAALKRRAEAEHPPAEVEAEVRVLAALGFLPKQFRLYSLLISYYASQTVNLYDPASDSLYVMTDITGDKFGPFGQIVFAHDYALALQDQHFDLGALLGQKGLNDDQALALQAFVEGSATQAMADYYLTLNLSEDEIFEGTTGHLRGDDELFLLLPDGIFDQVFFRYSAGSDFVAALREEGGWEAVNAAFARPPRSTEQISHPKKYLTNEEPAIVALEALTTTLGSGWHLVKANTIGEYLLVSHLAQQLDLKTATLASEGWGGDSYALYSTGSADLLVWEIAWDSAQDRQEFVTAYTGFKDAQYGAPASRSAEGQAWWETPRQTCVITWRDTTVLIITGPDAATVERVLQVSL